MPQFPSRPFVDRRSQARSAQPPGVERRQFTNSHSELSPAALQLAEAIDRYKLTHRRRFITYEEMLAIILELGYRQPEPAESETAAELVGV